MSARKTILSRAYLAPTNAAPGRRKSDNWAGALPVCSTRIGRSCGLVTGIGADRAAAGRGNAVRCGAITAASLRWEGPR